MNENKIVLVAAYLAELKPLIKYYNLQKDKHGFYSNDELIAMICEPGIIQAASSIGKLFASHSNIGALVNFGCAGGYDAISSFCLIDSLSFFQKKDFLPAPFRHKFKNYHLETKLEPCFNYKEGIVFDMEGWALYEAALKYLEKDLLFFVKVISDNPDTSFNKNSIALIVEKNLENFEKIFKKIKSIVKPQGLDISPWLKQFEKQFHITTYQHHELTSLLQRYLTLSLNPNIQATNCKTLIQEMKKTLSETKLSL